MGASVEPAAGGWLSGVAQGRRGSNVSALAMILSGTTRSGQSGQARGRGRACAAGRRVGHVIDRHGARVRHRHPAVTAAISGPRTMEQLESQLAPRTRAARPLSGAQGPHSETVDRRDPSHSCRCPSRPGPCPLRRHFPACRHPLPPRTQSSPGPAVTSSSPCRAQIRSRPPPESILSLPANATITSRPSVPVNRSLRYEPISVAAAPLHVGWEGDAGYCVGPTVQRA